MGKLWNKKVRLLLLACLLVLSVAAFVGCRGGKDSGGKERDLEFTVVGQNEVPQELQKIIEQKMNNPFKLTYSDEKALYIVVGYGQQKSGGYSITVPELYLTGNSVVIKTDLIGPEKSETAGIEPSYPYIVVKTEYLEQPVVFQ